MKDIKKYFPIGVRVYHKDKYVGEVCAHGEDLLRVSDGLCWHVDSLLPFTVGDIVCYEDDINKSYGKITEVKDTDYKGLWLREIGKDWNLGNPSILFLSFLKCPVSFYQEKTEVINCTCDRMLLMWQGCKCGAFHASKIR